MKYIVNLRNGIRKLVEKKGAYILGEDIQEPYGGAFKVTKGLSTEYPNNIIGTPMCEQGFFGAGVGMAMTGCYVIVEVMFGDFITLTCDQMINHAAKFAELYQEPLHLVLRCPSGGYRGYGATHSQSIEKIYLGIPGVKVVAGSIAHDVGALLYHSLEAGKPTLFVENKLDYPQDLLEESGDFWEKQSLGDLNFPLMRISVTGEKPDYTILVYGGLVRMALEVMKYFLYEEEINIDILIPSLISDVSGLENYVRSSKALILEEGVREFGWGAEVGCNLFDCGISNKRVGAKKRVISASKLWEKQTLPKTSEIIKIIREDLK